jgi:hypothetical protein
VTYLEMVNEVLVRMREDEITSVSDIDNDPQQKLVCKFVNDARAFVDKSHTWNANRKVWVVDLAKGIPAYTLFDSTEGGAVYTCRWAGKGIHLQEANARWMSQQKQSYGKPRFFSPSYVSNHEMQVRVWPIPDEQNETPGEVSEYNIAEYNEAEYSGSILSEESTTLVLEGFKGLPAMSKDSDAVVLPTDPVMYYALAYSSRERGEVGGQSSAELFQIAAQYLSDSIAWDVNNSDLEYVWRQV